MYAFAALLLAAIPLPGQTESTPAPKHPATPFRIFVFSDPRGEPEAVALIEDATKGCLEVAKRRKDWYAIASEREQAEIVLKVQASWIDEEMRIERSPLSDAPVNVARSHHYLIAEVTILGSRVTLRAEDGRSMKRAATRLMDALEEFCRKNYWEIDARRER